VTDLPLVLVVDDADDLRWLLADALPREAACEVRALAGGAEALAFLRDPAERRPCLILLDWMMPDLDGAAVLAAILGDAELAVIPVAVYTAANDIVAPGAVRVLRKPVALTVLVELTRRYCDGTRAAATPHTTATAPTPD
jgi:two-component system, chemotaxis family, chemotaxis protein CheY